jgi:hypothetical protein
MRPLIMRVSRVFVVALLASGAIMVCSAQGMAWLGWTIAVGLLSALLGANLLGTRLWSREAREARWERALFKAEKRPQAIASVRRALRKLTPVKQRTRSEHTRLSVLLAELLDAHGQYTEAALVVDDLPLDALSPLEGALVRHTRAVTHLRGSNAKAALAALDGRAPCGDVELDQRLSLLESYAKLELGDPPLALKRAAELENLPGIDESVVLDALGRKEEALVTLAALGRESLTPLADLGQPRVRELARMVLEGMN